jgi:hypothetical protein
VRGLIHGGRIKGRKCILIANARPQSNLLMISAGRIKYIKPGEVIDRLSERFEGTVYIPSDHSWDQDIEHLTNVEDVVVVIVPGEDEEDEDAPDGGEAVGT